MDKPKRSKIWRKMKQLVSDISFKLIIKIFRHVTPRVKKSAARAERAKRAPLPAQNQILDFTLDLCTNVLKLNICSFVQCMTNI